MNKRHMERYPASLTTREMQTKTSNEVPSHTSQNAYHQKNLQIINAREGVERRDLSYNVGGNVNWCSHYGIQYRGSLKN